MIWAVLHVCASLHFGNAIMCSAALETQPAERRLVMPQACGFYAWEGATAWIDCGHPI